METAPPPNPHLPHSLSYESGGPGCWVYLCVKLAGCVLQSTCVIALSEEVDPLRHPVPIWGPGWGHIVPPETFTPLSPSLCKVYSTISITLSSLACPRPTLIQSSNFMFPDHVFLYEDTVTTCVLTGKASLVVTVTVPHHRRHR